MKKFVWLVILGWLISVSATPADPVDLILEEPAPNRIILRYQPPRPEIQEMNADGHRYQLVQIENCAPSDSTGKLMLPVRRITLAIPPGATISARLLQQQTENLGQIICPAWHTLPENSVETHYFEDSQEFQTNALLPAAPFEIGKPAWLRYQQVVEIAFFPVRVNPVTQEALFNSEIVLEVTFESATSVIHSPPENLFEAVYAHTLANYQQGKAWRHRSMKIRKSLNSLLAGKWYKIEITKTGFHRIDGELLAAQAPGETIDPDQIQIFSTGGVELPTDLNAPEPELQEIAREVVDHNQNHRLDADDFVLFFGQGTTRWNESLPFGASRHFRHAYSAENVYWLRLNAAPGKRVIDAGKNISGTDFRPVTTTARHLFAEDEKWLMRNSGTVWIWDEFKQYTQHEYEFSLDTWRPDSTVRLTLQFYGNSSVHNLIDLRLNDLYLGRLDLPYTLSRTFTLPVTPATGLNRLKISLSESGSNVFFDWLELHFWQNLVARHNFLEFSSSGNSGAVEFRVDSISTPAISVYDISDPFSVKKLAVTFDSLTYRLTFRDSIPAGAVRSYQVLDSAHYRRLTALTPVEFAPDADLRRTDNQANYVIITDESLLGPELEKFVAHRQAPKYWPHATPAQIKVVTTTQIYQQFAWGLTDPAAIRNFLKYAFENWHTPPVYVLCVGDANYDYQNHYRLNQPLLVPAYSVGEKLTDDWFAYLTRDRKLDLITGRLPVKNRAELEIMVNKIINYDLHPPTGAWANQLLFVADDDYQKQTYTPADAAFMLDSEEMLQPPLTDFDISKIYLKYFPWDRSFNKPTAKTRLLEKINEGILFLNYLGHASWNVLSHEGLFNAFNDFPALENGERLPLFFAGTCEVALFDDPHLVSLGERFVLKENGGALALIASARWNVHHASQLLNTDFCQNLFQSGTQKPIGEILTAGKSRIGFPDQMELIFLFGDPAQCLHLPAHRIQFEITPDTLDLHHRVAISGRILENDVPFNGDCSIKIYDNAFRTNYYEKPVTRPGALLFSGSTKVTDGQFSHRFFLPAARSSGGDFGQIRLCAWEKDFGSFALGAQDSLRIQPDSLTQTAPDTIPPALQSLINEILLTAGKIPVVATNFRFTLLVSDSGSGIYLGSNAANQMQLWLDQNPVSDFNGVTHFKPDDSENASGRVEYSFENLAEGLHEISWRLSDNALNVAAGALTVRVVPGELRISRLLPYPNPADQRTWLTFTSTHAIEYEIKIYTIAGRQVREFRGVGDLDFNSLPPEGWDLRDETGDPLANGVYFFKLTVTDALNFSNEKQRVSEIGKIMILK